MGCNCQNTQGFKVKMAKARKLTEETGETHVVYVHKAVNQAFMRKETELNDELGICCYFLPDGTEIEWNAETAKSIEEQAAKKAEAVEATVSEEAKPASAKEINDFAKRIKGGEVMSSPEDLQFYKNNSEAIEEKLKK